MKILQLMRENLLRFGSPKHPFNKHNLLTLFSFSLGIILAGTYFFCAAKTFLEYANSIYAIIIFTAAAAIFGIMLWRLRIFYEFGNEAEKIIDDSKFDLFGFVLKKLNLVVEENPILQRLPRLNCLKTIKSNQVSNNKLIKSPNKIRIKKIPQ